jgi:ferredoxin-NADP reductase
MATHNIKLTARRALADGTIGFFFEKPAGFQSTAGQFARFTLIDPPETDAAGTARTFTLASAPCEDHLMFATRMRDTAFKRTISAMPIGTEVVFKGPYGSLTLHEDPARPAVFLTGGIGITPFRSIAVQAANDQSPHAVHLFYANRRPEDAAFLDELAALEHANPNYHFIGTMTAMAESTRAWAGETGYINREMLAKYVADLAAPIYYIVGPRPMVAAIKTLLDEAGIKPEDRRAEEFAGY